MNSSKLHARSVSYMFQTILRFVRLWYFLQHDEADTAQRSDFLIILDATSLSSSLIIWSMNAKNNETFQYCFSVVAGWLALVVCRPHRLGIFSMISRGSDNSNADWYISFQTNEPCTVICAPKTTCLRLSITNSNLVKDTSYLPILS